MKHRLSIFSAAMAALFATPIACFASVNPILFAAVINDAGLLQFGVGTVVGLLNGWLFKNKTPVNNNYIPIINTAVTAALYHFLGGVPFQLALNQGGLTAVGTGALQSTAKGVVTQGNQFLVETPADREKRLAKQKQ